MKPGQFGFGETFIVSQVQVCFGAVFKHVYFAVLEGVHSAGIDVQVGVKLLHGDANAAVLQQRSQSGGG